jgi:hypothetical protein
VYKEKKLGYNSIINCGDIAMEYNLKLFKNFTIGDKLLLELEILSKFSGDAYDLATLEKFAYSSSGALLLGVRVVNKRNCELDFVWLNPQDNDVSIVNLSRNLE